MISRLQNDLQIEHTTMPFFLPKLTLQYTLQSNCADDESDRERVRDRVIDDVNREGLEKSEFEVVLLVLNAQKHVDAVED